MNYLVEFWMRYGSIPMYQLHPRLQYLKQSTVHIMLKKGILYIFSEILTRVLFCSELIGQFYCILKFQCNFYCLIIVQALKNFLAYKAPNVKFWKGTTQQ